ncbi:zona pellucida protein C isoform X2 [Plectropomus leopardus]|uniref:zona pellucida protein C isoform X2 n=1 Tax=Plectropomus leopardus TaxID=160734 RepID=UPI001C4CBBFF|nr:zona pellucida protein C isoform X2 [Plectropomus leopardus]
MGTIEIFLCVFLGRIIAAQSVIKKQEGTFFQDVPGFFDNVITPFGPFDNMRPFTFERNFDFTPYDPIFSSWQTPSPDFHMLADFSPMVIVPRVEVFCDQSKLTVLVDKRSNDVVLTGDELQLGDGCYSNRELPNRFVFTYGLDECGTTSQMQKGLVRFTNTLHLNLKKMPSTWWPTPSTVHISCTPKRSYDNLNYFVSMTFPENGNTFTIKAMNPSWNSAAESNVYERGQVVNLQVSAKTRPEQQLFIQSCFVSASPEPQTRRRHAVIMNKGCTAPLGSPHAVVQFVASDRADVVNFVLNTSYLISELYIHCTVLVSDQGVTFGSKSCNYNVIQSRWQDLSGNVEVCECCSSRCKGLSARQIHEDARSTVSIGPLVIVDHHVEMSPEPPGSEPQETSSALVPDATKSDSAATEDTIVSGTSVSRPPQGVVVVSQDPGARLTLWLPGQVRDAERRRNIDSESEENLTVQSKKSDTVSNDPPELKPSTTDQEAPPLTNKVEEQSVSELESGGRMLDLNLLTQVVGWIIPPMENMAFVKESQRKQRFGRSGVLEAPQEIVVPLTAEMTVNVLNQNDLNQMKDELADAAEMPQEEPNDAQPIIRSKIQFSKGGDGLQTLSYEEEVEGKDVIRRFRMDRSKRKQEPRQRGLRSAFLDFLRGMDKAE